MKVKDPDAKPTRKQTWAVFCMTKQDIRKRVYTRGEVAKMINELNEHGESVAPDGLVLSSKSKPRKGEKVKKYKSSWAEDLVKKAEEAGQKAMDELIDSNKVLPMVVQRHLNQLDDNSPVVESWSVPGGPCGFAFVRVKCTNGPSRKFINQLKKAGKAGDRNSFKDWTRSDYYGGYLFSFTLIGGQSLAYKQAYAGAFEKVLLDEGINAAMFSRMD